MTLSVFATLVMPTIGIKGEGGTSDNGTKGGIGVGMLSGDVGVGSVAGFSSAKAVGNEGVGVVVSIAIVSGKS